MSLMKPRRRRTLAPEEHDLWQSVAKTVTRRGGAKKNTNAAQDTPELMPLAPSLHRAAGAIPAPPPAYEPLPRFRVGERAARTALPHAPSAQSQPVMDAKLFSRMTRGKLTPEARIDLHGMTLSEAQPELTRFIMQTRARGMRLVLVITGKGKNTRHYEGLSQRSGVLRRQVPHWLRLAPLNTAVLDVNEAHMRHGGGGAYYVYLRRL